MVFDGGRARELVGNRLGVAGFVLLATLFAFVLFADPAWAQAQLSITKKGPAVVEQGANFTYTLNVTNAVGADTATTVTVTDDLPAGVTFVSSTPAGCTNNQGTVTCTINNLDAGETQQIKLKVQAPNTPGQISNEASASGGGSTATSNTVVTSVNPADLQITKTATPTKASVGDYILYRLVVTNNGPKEAKNVRIKDTLPSNVEFSNVNSSSNVTGGCAQSSTSSAIVTCGPFDLPNQNTATVNILVRAAQNGTAENTAVVTASNDPDNTNNQATASTTISNNNRRHHHNNGGNNNNNNNQYNDNNENEDDNNQYNDNGNASNNSEATTASGNQYEDTLGNGGASASVGPGGARAQAGGANAGRTPDQYAPETGPRGDVVNEVPTEGPLPNTGGLSILAVILPIVGFLILSAALITRIRNSR